MYTPQYQTLKKSTLGTPSTPWPIKSPHLHFSSPQKPFDNAPASPAINSHRVLFQSPNLKISKTQSFQAKSPQKNLSLSTIAQEKIQILKPSPEALLFARVDEVCSKFTTLSQRVQSMEARLMSNQEQLERLSQNIQQCHKKIPELSQLVSKQVGKQMAENHQHLSFQSKLIKAELDTIKLQMKDPPRRQIDFKLEKLAEDFEILVDAKIAGVLEMFSQQGEKLKKMLQPRPTGLKADIFSLLKINFQICLADNPEQPTNFSAGEVTYGVDSEGYLLDEEGVYLVSLKGDRIRLQAHHIQRLKESMILS